jgi:hypothetical protein
MSPVGHDPAVDRLEIRPAKRHQLSCASSRSTFGNRDIGEREAFAGQPGLRSELRISSPIGYAWDRYVGLGSIRIGGCRR